MPDLPKFLTMTALLVVLPRPFLGQGLARCPEMQKNNGTWMVHVLNLSGAPVLRLPFGQLQSSQPLKHRHVLWRPAGRGGGRRKPWHKQPGISDIKPRVRVLTAWTVNFSQVPLRRMWHT